MGHLELKRLDGSVAFAGEYESMKELLEAAVKSGANLARANLARANLAGANLAGANLARANLARANLARANLVDANLADANLADANLAGANLAGANLADANLVDANLADANLAGANLVDANLAGANLARAYLVGATNAALAMAQTVIVPDGSLIVWKKCKGDVLVKLRVPEEARRSCASGRKCRAEFVDVLEVVGADVGIGMRDGKTKYVVGERTTCDSWCEDRWSECAGGIHFFLTKEEAVAWNG